MCQRASLCYCVRLVLVISMQAAADFPVSDVVSCRLNLLGWCFFVFFLLHFISCFIKSLHTCSSRERCKTSRAEMNSPSFEPNPCSCLKAEKSTAGPLTRANLSDFLSDTGRFTPRTQQNTTCAHTFRSTYPGKESSSEHIMQMWFSQESKKLSAKKKKNIVHLVKLYWKFSARPVCVSVCVWFLQAWMTVSSSTSRLLRGRKSGGTNCCVSPTRSWRIWECPESATKSSYWRLWTYCVLWWVQASHVVFPLLCCHSKESQMKIFFSTFIPSSNYQEWSKSFKSHAISS